MLPLLVAPLLVIARDVETGLDLGGVEDGEDEAVEMGMSGREIVIGEATVLRALMYCTFFAGVVAGVGKCDAG